MPPKFYEPLIAVIDQLILLEPELDTPEGRLLSRLADAVIEYETVMFPLAGASIDTGELQ